MEVKQKSPSAFDMCDLKMHLVYIKFLNKSRLKKAIKTLLFSVGEEKEENQEDINDFKEADNCLSKAQVDQKKYTNVVKKVHKVYRHKKH